MDEPPPPFFSQHAGKGRTRRRALKFRTDMLDFADYTYTLISGEAENHLS